MSSNIQSALIASLKGAATCQSPHKARRALRIDPSGEQVAAGGDGGECSSSARGEERRDHLLCQMPSSVVVTVFWFLYEQLYKFKPSASPLPRVSRLTAAPIAAEVSGIGLKM